ncbi:right-handed parallel beta-helix repeat-containing protein [Actinoallomurus soli]|uniref:right-handed parallel beta-helix repeat-containing protein n=1 Tax=Actinoallomurus soli TaxID=2952535 RepID=UPI002092526C|nr:right-handed parallel beta-helix repeat-containing protein [Actinoallomurus soli]MCO5969388.1 right-handed parallel beta-helix repeat-containing protein [Actinoallomurus soli]
MGRFARRLLVAVVSALSTTVITSSVLASSAAASPGRAVTPPAGVYHIPAYRPAPATQRLVVCKPGGHYTGLAQQLAPECAYHDVQAAVDAVRQRGTTIYVLPGTYREQPSLAAPSGACRALAGASTLTYEQERSCPHLRSLISVFGLGDLQIEGVGDGVVVEGDKPIGVRADRADGFYLRGVTVRGFKEDGVAVVETDGFVLDRVTARDDGREGLAAYGTDHGVIADCEATGNGDAGIATASASDQRGNRLSVEIRDCRSHGNLIGYSGTAGDSVYVHDNEFSGNATGAVLDSSVQAVGMPQNHAMFVANRVFGNNADPYRDCGSHCPARAVPVGTGMLLAGGDENTYASNFVYDNWRYGIAQYWIPASRRGETDPAKQRDTSHGNRYVGNLMGVTPFGASAPNGVDFWWDEQGDGNCWQNNASSWGRPRSDPAALPDCDHPSSGGPYAQQGNPAKTAIVTACAAYAPGRPQPARCGWLTAPSKPAS